MKLRALFFVGASALVAISCAKNGKRAGTRDTGQSRLMSQTFAGQNACNPDNHLRPFIIEWDATDMSSFESYAANDIVVVRYEGCALTVLDECRNDSIRGSQGSYRPPEWTSGSLETIGISNEAELVAKLPLGAASLGGRVSGGETFHMEYFVAGTRNATRDSVYFADIANNPGCAGATHFVYGYNLGAFALASTNKLDTEVSGSYFGFGAQTQTASNYSADKKGGDLGVCRSDSATEVSGCKAPIRLTLRPIREGENPQKETMTVADTDDSLNAAGLINLKMQMGEQAQALLQSAQAKYNAKDGAGCLAELDAVARIEPKFDSTDPNNGVAMIRAQCLMLAGQCDAGKVLARKVQEKGPLADYGPEMIDKSVEGLASAMCQGKMGDRDAVLKALRTLQMGAGAKKEDPKVCQASFQTVEKLHRKVKPKDAEDREIAELHESLDRAKNYLAMCMGRGGDCKGAAKIHAELNAKSYERVADQAQREEMLRNAFHAMVPTCKDK